MVKSYTACLEVFLRYIASQAFLPLKRLFVSLVSHGVPESIAWGLSISSIKYERSISDPDLRPGTLWDITAMGCVIDVTDSIEQ